MGIIPDIKKEQIIRTFECIEMEFVCECGADIITMFWKEDIATGGDSVVCGECNRKYYFNVEGYTEHEKTNNSYVRKK